MSRYLGVDYGTKRIGLAISDALGLTARPLEVVARGSLEAALLRIKDTYEPELAVIGLPTALGGHEGESATGARQLADEVSEILDIPVEFVDERFTSRMAENALLESGMRRRDRKATVDKIAAAIILQTYLDARRRPGNSARGPDVETT